MSPHNVKEETTGKRRSTGYWHAAIILYSRAGKKLPVRILGILVGATLMLLSTRNILMAAGLM